MVYANSFRYGEISRKNAGRFDSDFYRNGCFKFRNMVTDFTGSASRRPPIRKLIDTDAKLLVEFSISETLAYTIGISPTTLRMYRYVLGEYKEVANVGYPDSRTLTDAEISELRWAQYYTRMYFVHQDFRPFFIDFDTASETITISNMTVILNQDAKDKYWFTPSYVADENGDEVPALEGRVLYPKETEDGITVWYLDAEYDKQYEYSTTYPPVHGESSYISNYDEYEDDDLLTGPGNYPAGISIISDSIWLYNTANHPQVFWKSRFLGSSQWIEGFEADSMHDFVQFQAVYTDSIEMVEQEEIPKKDLTDPYGEPYYEQINGNQVWYQPDKDSDGNYTYQTRVYLYKDIDDDTTERVFCYDPDNPEGSLYDIEKNGYPVGKPIQTYDFSDTSKLLRTIVAIDYVSTDSCACRIELNTGRMDRINDIVAASGYIFVLTSSSEWRLPENFSAVNNATGKPYQYYGSQNIRSVVLNSSLLFLQKSGVLREFYLYQGYLANGDATTLNHDILADGVFQFAVKNTPDPRIFAVMYDGTVVTLTYDKENGIQSFSRWDMDGRRVIAAAKLSGVLRDQMLFLVSSDTEQWIGYLDEQETENFSDEGGVPFVSDIITPYTEVIDNALVFGKYKKAQRAWIRPYQSGHIETGNDGDKLTLSDRVLGNEDFAAVITGTSRRQFSFEIKAHGTEPMTILSYAYEVV